MLTWDTCSYTSASQPDGSAGEKINIYKGLQKSLLQFGWCYSHSKGSETYNWNKYYTVEWLYNVIALISPDRKQIN